MLRVSRADGDGEQQGGGAGGRGPREAFEDAPGLGHPVEGIP